MVCSERVAQSHRETGSISACSAIYRRGPTSWALHQPLCACLGVWLRPGIAGPIRPGQGWVSGRTTQPRASTSPHFSPQPISYNSKLV